MFVHGLKKKPGGLALLIVNTLNTAASVNIPSNGEQFMLTANELETRKIQLNGKDLALTANDEIPFIKGKVVKAGVIKIPAHSITFLTFLVEKNKYVRYKEPLSIYVFPLTI